MGNLVRVVVSGGGEPPDPPDPPGPPGAYGVQGPTQGEVCNIILGLQGHAQPSTFTVSLGTPYSTTIITPYDSTGTGTFEPRTLTLTEADPSQTVDYYPGEYGTRTITFANNRGWANVTKPFMVIPQIGKGINQLGTDPRWPNNRQNPDFGGYLLFGGYDPAKPMSFWNQQCVNDPLDPNSTAILSLFDPYTPPVAPWQESIRLGFNVGYEYPWPGGASYLMYGDVYNISHGNQQPLADFVCEQYCTNSDVGPIRMDPLASAGAYYGVPVITHPWPGDEYMLPAEYGYDQHAMTYDIDNHELIETYSSYTEDGGATWRGFLAKWDEAGGQLRPDGWTSATGGGASKLQLLLRYDECRRCAATESPIPHALRYTVKNWAGTNKMQWPARHAAGYANSVPALVWGSRIRLKEEYYNQILAHASFVGDDLYKKMARTIVRTMRYYGLMMDDYGDPFTITATMDERWDPSTFGVFAQINGGFDLYPQMFEVILIEPGYSLEGPTTGTVGVPVVYTVTRQPVTDINFSGSLFLMVDGALVAPQVTVGLYDANPSDVLPWTPPAPGTYTITCYGLDAAYYWFPPPSITLVVSA